jgi:hypothetical protein
MCLNYVLMNCAKLDEKLVFSKRVPMRKVFSQRKGMKKPQGNKSIQIISASAPRCCAHYQTCQTERAMRECPYLSMP